MVFDGYRGLPAPIYLYLYTTEQKDANWRVLGSVGVGGVKYGTSLTISIKRDVENIFKLGKTADGHGDG